MLPPKTSATPTGREESQLKRNAIQNLKSNELKRKSYRVLHPVLSSHRLHRPMIHPRVGHQQRGSPSFSYVGAEDDHLNDETDNSKAKRRLGKWSKSLKDNIVAPLSPSINTVVASYSSVFKHLSVMRKELKDARDLDPDTRQKISFLFSSSIGTGILCSMFKLLSAMLTSNRFFVRPLSPSKAFAVSYYIAYLFSVLWQHLLNRWIVFESSEESFLDSLFSTYVVYGFSMLLTSVISMGLITVCRISSSSAFWLTLPINGVSNFYLLRRCLSVENQQPQINSVITVV